MFIDGTNLQGQCIETMLTDCSEIFEKTKDEVQKICFFHISECMNLNSTIPCNHPLVMNQPRFAPTK